MPVRRSIYLALLCGALTGLTGHAQDAQETQPSAPPTPTALVRTELFATREGQPVLDLTRDDIQLLEDGAPQILEALDVVRPRADAASAVSVVVFVDTLHSPIETTSALRLALGRALEEGLGPTDRVALFTPERVASELEFHTVTEVVANLAQADWPWARPNAARGPDPKEALYDGCFASQRGGAEIAAELKARRREKSSLDALDELVALLERQSSTRTVVVLASEGWRLFGERSELAQPRRPSGGVDTPFGRLGGGRGRRPDPPAVSGVSRVECEADLRALARLDHSQRGRALSEAANRALVSFVAVTAAGLGGAQRIAQASDAVRVQEAGLDSLRFLADNTMGAVAAAGPTTGLAAILAAEGAPYFIARFRSANAKLDGRFRTLSVRTTRPDVKVRVRRGYRGLTAEDLLSGSGRGRSRSANDALTSVGRNPPTSPFTIRSAAWAPGGGGGVFWIVGELDLRLRRELVWSAAATAEITVLAADGRSVLTRTIDLPPAENSFAIRVPEDGDMPPGDYAVRARVAPEGDPRVELSDTTRVALGRAPRGLSEPLVWRRGLSTGPRFAQTSSAKFQRRDRIRLEFATAAQGTPTGRLVDRAGEPLRVPVSASIRNDATDEGLRWVVAELALAPLAAGEYEIEVELSSGLRGAFSFVVTP